MDDEFILTVGDKQFLLNLDEAVGVARTLNSALFIGKEWFPNVSSNENHVLKPPSSMSAVLSPMTAILKMQLERNQKLLEEKSK
jgi:hypothetical protein